MVRTMVALVAVVVAALVAWYYFGGVHTFDPDAAGRDARAKIAPGMTWTQVVDQTTAPRKFIPYRRLTKKLAGQDVQVVERGTPIPFDRALMTRDMAAGGFPDGFIFPYQFSHQVAFEVEFDAKGIVTGVADMRTMADLLDTRQSGE